MNQHEQGTSVTEYIPVINDPYRSHRKTASKTKKAIAASIVSLSIVVVLLGSIVLATGLGLGGSDAVHKVNNVVAQHTDSGVEGCKQIADNAKKSKSNTTDSQDQTTVQAYEKAKQPFQNSRYADVKVAGTNLITGIEQMEKAANSDDDSAFGAALVGLGQLQANWTALQTACANHGVDIPPLNLTN